jgi:cyclic pyranopterin phosphate synthase
VDLIHELAKIQTVHGRPLDLAVTTNGHLLDDQAARLRDAGLSRITVSMDAIDSDRFRSAAQIVPSMLPPVE